MRAASEGVDDVQPPTLEQPSSLVQSQMGDLLSDEGVLATALMWWPLSDVLRARCVSRAFAKLIMGGVAQERIRSMTMSQWYMTKYPGRGGAMKRRGP